MKTAEFRKELTKIMPGYKWTVHHKLFKDDDYFNATGIQSSGVNRTSTLYVERFVRGGHVKYKVESSGFGKNAPWLGEAENTTLARALRDLQNYYEWKARQFASHAAALKQARITKV